MQTDTLLKAAPSPLARKLPALAAIALGGSFIFLAGFAHMEVVHNAAHDVRHSFAFPCH